ncbi:TetR/AcrR family transcriptional regulator [Brachybacterium hainanense]|uniref:TetR/AcrR family transcriptional regulator n=1 Tax=Brachybacterium hainanense TaxID=1541174 RepID=A0ABV6RDB0_9MICO
MARPRAFDETAVLDAAAREFRVHGFAGTSTEQLCGAAGVRRSSLYNTFVSKEELFLRALRRYVEVTGARQRSVLADESVSGAQRLRDLLELIIGEEQEARSRGHAAGCMVVQSLMDPDLRGRDPRVADILEGDLRARISQLEGAIRAGQSDGSVSRRIDPAEGALLVTTVISGLRVTAQTGTPPEALRSIALAGLAALLLPRA